MLNRLRSCGYRSGLCVVSMTSLGFMKAHTIMARREVMCMALRNMRICFWQGVRSMYSTPIDNAPTLFWSNCSTQAYTWHNQITPGKSLKLGGHRCNIIIRPSCRVYCELSPL